MQNWIPNFNKLDITIDSGHNIWEIHFPKYSPLKVFEVPVRQAVK
jgi:hypothetical protein